MIRDERGISLVEIVVGLAIAALIGGILVTIIFQIFDITAWGNSDLTVQHDLQNAATWLNRDVLTASEAEVIGSRMVLTIPTFITDTLDYTNITYTYSKTVGTLTRDPGDSPRVIARHVISEPFPWLPDPIEAPNVVTVTLHSEKGDVPGSGTFALKMRAGGSMQVVAPCPITAGESDVYSKTVSSLIINNGSESATIKQIEIVWPSSNGLLRQIKFGDSQIWAGGEEPPSWTIHKPEWWDAPGILEIAGGATHQKKLELGFENIAASDKDLYSIEVIFDNGCTVNWP